jgi:hypothetical protein
LITIRNGGEPDVFDALSAKIADLRFGHWLADL